MCPLTLTLWMPMTKKRALASANWRFCSLRGHSAGLGLWSISEETLKRHTRAITYIKRRTAKGPTPHMVSRDSSQKGIRPLVANMKSQVEQAHWHVSHTHVSISE